MRTLFTFCVSVLALILFGGHALAQMPSTAPSMPPPPPIEKKITCPDDKYVRGGHYEYWNKWKWSGPSCRKKPSYWKPGCKWIDSRWVATSKGSRFKSGHLSCLKKLGPPPPRPTITLKCPSSQYVRGGRYNPRDGEWIWEKSRCAKKPKKWFSHCKWKLGYWTAKGKGYTFTNGYLDCSKRGGGAAADDLSAVKPKRGGGAAADDLNAVTTAKVTPPGPARGRLMPILAVFDIEVVDLKLKRSFKTSLADFVAMRMTETRAFQVLPRSQVKKRLVQSKKASFKECYDQACQIEIGKELAAEKTLATKISKMGRRCMISMGVYDLRRATAERAATHVGKCKEDDLFESVEQAIGKLTKVP